MCAHTLSLICAGVHGSSHTSFAQVGEREGERRGRRRRGGGSEVVVLDESDESTDEVQIMEPLLLDRYIG